MKRHIKIRFQKGIINLFFDHMGLIYGQFFLRGRVSTLTQIIPSPKLKTLKQALLQYTARQQLISISK